MAKQFRLDKKDITNRGKVILYSGAAAIVTGIIASLTEFDIPSQYLFLMPIVNTLLVALKDFLEDRAE